MSTTPQDVLMDAARILMRHGWIQGDPYRWNPETKGNSACALGAISAVAQADFVNVINARELLTRWLELPEGREGNDHPVAIWNDAPERTAEDVILALKRAASESA